MSIQTTVLEMLIKMFTHSVQKLSDVILIFVLLFFPENIKSSWIKALPHVIAEGRDQLVCIVAIHE